MIKKIIENNLILIVIFLYSFNLLEAYLEHLTRISKILTRIPKTHINSRYNGSNNNVYNNIENGNILRPVVPDDKVSWNVDWPDYKKIRVTYTSEKILNKPSYADLEIHEMKEVKWNKIDGRFDRRSYHGDYTFLDGLPRNPVGRTGIKGRGLLGKWGPNHAADCIVTRWNKGEINGKKILEFVAIQRKKGAWAIPGGMVDPNENVINTLKREFMEEALNNNERLYNISLKKFFSKRGIEVYKGYVDDPRNTDNAWMETYAYNYHDEKGSVFKSIDLKAGDDAKNVSWMPISREIKLYASHLDFIKKVAKIHRAYW